MKIECTRAPCSFNNWYPLFSKNALESVTLTLPEQVRIYLEHEAFLLPAEATTNNGLAADSEWSDGSAVNDDSDEDAEKQPTFPEFSRQIQAVIDDFGAVFVKSNWSTPSDATWVTSTKTLKCCSLEDVYLLLKSSDRISQDLNFISSSNERRMPIQPCLVLKRWRDIDPCTEFRCFVLNKELIGICQRDASQYYKHIENDKYDIQKDIKSLFLEKIKDKFTPLDYTFDVIRYKKDKVKLLDFGVLDELSVKGTLFTYEELRSDIKETPEFRFIAEEVGIQPKNTKHICVPQEVNEYFQVTNGGQMSVMDALRREVEDQGNESSGNDES